MADIMEEKKKLEQIILIIIIPIFILSFLYMRLKRKEAPTRSYEEVSLEAEYEEGKAIGEDETIDTIPKPAGVLDVRYEASSKNPLEDLLQAHLYKLKLEEKTKQKVPEKREAIPLPELDIGGLIWDTDMPQAIVNGKIVKAGDTIEGLKVVKIEKTGLTVIHQGESVFIPRRK